MSAARDRAESMFHFAACRGKSSAACLSLGFSAIRCPPKSTPWKVRKRRLREHVLRGC